MLHSKRIWSIASVATAEELASKLVQYTWTGCQAFQLDGYIFANDSTSPDGAQEYAVLRATGAGDELVQVESITFSWCDESQSLALILKVKAGDCDSYVYDRVSRNRFQTASEHGVCGLCA
ncbi:MAG: hypothetical protein ABL921_28440 [Pirellula sp.]